jgi:hypothetical protein
VVWQSSQLLQIALTSPGLLSGELLRLRNRVHLYAVTRVKMNCSADAFHPACRLN